MTATLESIVDAALLLEPNDRCRVATRLWDSIGPALREVSGDELEIMLDQREIELNQDPSQAQSHEEFIAHFAARRRS